MSRRTKTKKSTTDFDASDVDGSAEDKQYYQIDLDTDIRTIPSIIYQAAVIKQLYNKIYIGENASQADAKQIAAAEVFDSTKYKTLEQFYNNLPGTINTREAVAKYKYKTTHPNILFSSQPCPYCHSKQVELKRLQARSLDEPTTIYNQCQSCGRKFGTV